MQGERNRRPYLRQKNENREWKIEHRHLSSILDGYLATTFLGDMEGGNSYGSQDGLALFCRGDASVRRDAYLFCSDDAAAGDGGDGGYEYPARGNPRREGCGLHGRRLCTRLAPAGNLYGAERWRSQFGGGVERRIHGLFSGDRDHRRA